MESDVRRLTFVGGLAGVNKVLSHLLVQTALLCQHLLQFVVGLLQSQSQVLVLLALSCVCRYSDVSATTLTISLSS